MTARHRHREVPFEARRAFTQFQRSEQYTQLLQSIRTPDLDVATLEATFLYGFGAGLEHAAEQLDKAGLGLAHEQAPSSTGPYD